MSSEIEHCNRQPLTGQEREWESMREFEKKREKGNLANTNDTGKVV